MKHQTTSLKSCLRVKSLDESLESTRVEPQQQQSSSPKPSIKFSSVEIREYPRIVGDNPSCASGAPMSMDWCHYPQQYYEFDDFEEGRPEPRGRSEMQIPSRIRHQMLCCDWGCSMQSIMAAAKETKHIRELRNKTATQSDRSFKKEERLEMTGRILKSVFHLRRRSRSSVKLLGSDVVHLRTSSDGTSNSSRSLSPISTDRLNETTHVIFSLVNHKNINL